MVKHILTCLGRRFQRLFKALYAFAIYHGVLFLAGIRRILDIFVQDESTD